METDLNCLRSKEINKIDNKLLKLFNQRCKYCNGVFSGEYKKMVTGVKYIRSERESEVLNVLCLVTHLFVSKRKFAIYFFFVSNQVDF